MFERTTKEKVFDQIIKYMEKHDYINVYLGCSEPGYDDNTVIAADYNEPRISKAASFLETNYPNISLEWCDEWTSCQECGKAVRTIPDSYSWIPYYTILNECELFCFDCITLEDLLPEYLNNTSRAVTPEFQDQLEAAGFKQYNGDYETGFHPGQDDMPEDKIKLIDTTKFNYIFMVNYVGQFDTSWSMWIKKVNKTN
jgi:hypothetical protein